mgnify:CR=1 FL=1
MYNNVVQLPGVIVCKPFIIYVLDEELGKIVRVWVARIKVRRRFGNNVVRLPDVIVCSPFFMFWIRSLVRLFGFGLLGRNGSRG